MYIFCTILFLAVSALGQQLIPSTLNGPHFFMAFDGTITINYGNKINMAHHNEYSFVWSANPATLPMYNLTNPQMALSYYIPFSRDPDFRDITWWQQFQPTWIVYTCDRVTPARLYGEPNGPVVLDITNPAVVAWQIANYAQVGQQLGYSFIAADNFAIGNAVSGCGVYNASGNWTQKYTGQFTDDAYARDVTNWLKAFRTQLKQMNPPMNLAINFVIGGSNMYSDIIQNVTNNIDAVVDEAGVTQWGGGLNDEATWLNILNYVEYIQSLGKAYFMINEFDVVNQWAKEYAMGSYLLCKNQAAAVVITTIQGYGIETFLPEYANLQIGSPLAGKYKSNCLWMRQYSNGTVLVNADPANCTYTLPQNCVDAFGGYYPAGSTVIIQYHQGLVLGYAPYTAPTVAPTVAAIQKPGAPVIMVSRGSTWTYSNLTSIAATWTSQTFDDSQWASAKAPFVNNYASFSSSLGSYTGGGSYFGPTPYYFRQHFSVPSGAITSMTVNVAADNNCNVYINGVLVDQDPNSWHAAAYWNRQITFAPSMIVAGVNTITVWANNNDQWAYFDLELSALFGGAAGTYAPTTAPATAAPTVAPTPTPAATQKPGSPTSAPGSTSVVVPKGSYWLYYNKSVPTGTWYAQGYDDSQWTSSIAPFVTGYSYYQGCVSCTPFGKVDYYFRYKFTINSASTLTSMTVNVASDNYASAVYVNGVLVDSDPQTWHVATYWNRQVSFAPTMIVNGVNTIAVVVRNMDAWAFFDLELDAQWGGSAPATIAPTAVPATVAPTTAPATPSPATSAPSTVAPPSGGASSVVVSRGSSWTYYNKSAPAATWTSQTFDDSQWASAKAPFANNYASFSSSLGSYTGGGSYFGPTAYYFRDRFSIPAGSTITSMTVNVASDNNCNVYINGVLVDSDPVTWHAAAYWNRQTTFSPSMIVPGVNTITVLANNNDQWAYFDLELSAVSSGSVVPATSAPTVKPATQAPATAAPVLPTAAPATTAPTQGGSLMVTRGSTWKYSSTAPAATWIQQTFDDSQWASAKAPFANNYAAFSSSLGSYTGGGSYFGPTTYYFRQRFTVPAGSTVTSMTVNVASDNNCNVYINGVLVDSDPVTWHAAAYWNRQTTFSPSMIVPGVNTITVLANNNDQWAYFDLELSAQVSGAALPATSAPATSAPAAPATSAPATTAPVKLPTSAPAAPTQSASAPTTCTAAQVGFMTCTGDLTGYYTCANGSWQKSTCTTAGTKCFPNGNYVYCGWAS